jgi:acyl-coenzyme A thioesterase PaaI-like protein
MTTSELFKKFSSYPLGKKLFSKIVARRAPYFSSIAPVIFELSETNCVVLLKKRKAVLNHIKTVHAIAMCNACELAFGMTMEAGGLPKNLRWIPKGMTVRYLKKAETDLKAIAHVPNIGSFTPGDHVIKVVVQNTSNEVVMDAEITVYISEKKT